VDAKNIGIRLKNIRKYSGLSRLDFGKLFNSEESTVYQWERGYCVPRLVKLFNISGYFGLSLDCILRGKAISDNALEKNLSGIAEPIFLHNEGQFLSKFLTLSDHNRERMMGYLDALYRENGK
jgi:transcriptional regulator with XRE-family HTH domain